MEAKSQFYVKQQTKYMIHIVNDLLLYSHQTEMDPDNSQICQNLVVIQLYRIYFLPEIAVFSCSNYDLLLLINVAFVLCLAHSF